VKRLDVLHEFVPQARRIAVLVDPTTISTRAQLARAARELDVELVPFEAGNPDELGRALDAIAAAKVEAVNVLASPFLQVSRSQIIARMRDHRLPAIYQWPESAEDGGLLAYGPRILLCYRHVVSLVDKVLRGSADRAANQVRAGGESQDRERTRYDDLADAPIARRRGDRVKRREFFVRFC
jgi:ABC-type uncharacterized transport system substrate-binding protein